MVYKEHFIELWINGSKVELEDQESLNMRFNNVITDPTKISSNQAEYSFEFEIPATPKNNVILDYANNLGKLNKFHQRYNAEVYADGTVIFTGTITINGFKENKYQLNLVSVKTYSLDDIFGDATMDNIPWYIPFEGAGSSTTPYTIDWYNNEMQNMNQNEVCFPLVSYGAFQKSPYVKDSVASEYTSKFDLDKYNRWYIESFYPSVSMIETIRKAFEWKEYTVSGDAFKDYFLNDIFCSVNLADGQSPSYNLGNPKFGKVDLDVSFNTVGAGYEQDLTYPYFKMNGYIDYRYSTAGTIVSDEYNLTAIQLYDILSDGSVTVENSSYMYQPNEHIIVIPSDGFYKIELSVNARLNTTSQLTASQWVKEWNDDIGALNLSMEEKDIQFTPDITTTTPIEIQLVRNYDDNIELIKGKHNMQFMDGYPDHATQGDRGRSTNYVNRYTCFPHEKLGSLYGLLGIPTNGGELLSGDFYDKNASVGYMYADGEIMMYDNVVSPNFICGFSSLGNKNGYGCGAVMKNGYSWSKLRSEKNEVFNNEIGYEKMDLSSDYMDLITTPTDKYYNSYVNAPVLVFNENKANGAMNGRICCIAYLHKNDILQLYAVHRDYNTTSGTKVSYSTSVNAHLSIEAFSDRSYEMIKHTHSNRYEAPTEFDVNLKLSNFFNKEKKVSEWIQNAIDAFNLEVIQNGKNVEINTKKKSTFNNAAVDIDDRANYSEAELKAIEYPKSMAVKYKIDDDEWGFERSAVNAAGGDESILNNDDWKKYADSGYTTIQLNDDSYVTSTSDKNLQFSYTWYDTFHWYATNNTFETQDSTAVDIQLPVISKFTYMIDGYDYEESMKHDGYGLAQRFWFKPNQTPYYVWTRTYPAEMVTLYIPSNNYNKLKLNYKDVEGSLLNTFFNVNAYLASNYVIIDVYLSADEYNMIKNGALVKFDDDLYIPVEISAYDPSGYNKTTLKLMKKVA